MRQAVPKKTKQAPKVLEFFSRFTRLILFGIFVIIALAIALSIYSYHPEDSAWSRAVESETLNNTIHNLMGARGAYFADIFLSAIGKATWLFPLLLVGIGYQLFMERKILTISFEKIVFKLIGALVTIFALASLLDIQSGSGGIMGRFIGTELTSFTTNILSLSVDSALLYITIFLSLILLVGLMLLTGSTPIRWAEWVGARLLAFLSIFFDFSPREMATSPETATPKVDPSIHLKKLSQEEEQNAIERIINPETKEKPGFFARLFSKKEESQQPQKSDEMLDITEAISRDEPRMSPQQDPHNELSFSYAPHKTELNDEEIEEMNEDEEPYHNSKKPIPSIFRGARKQQENNTPERVTENVTASSIKGEETTAQPAQANAQNISAWAIANENEEKSTLSFDDLGFNNAPESWQDFIRHDGSEEVKEPEPHVKVEPRGIPSIFKNIFKPKNREEVPKKAEPSLEIDPLIQAEDLTVEIPEEEFTQPHTLEERFEQVFHEQPIPQAPSPAPADNGEDSPFVAIEEIPVAQSPEMMPISDNPQRYQMADSTPVEVSAPSEMATHTPQRTVTENPAAAHLEENTTSLNLEAAKAAQQASEERYIGHDIDPRSGMPIPKKAEKEYPMAGQLPSLDLLANPLPPAKNYDEEELQELSAKIEEQLQHFNIQVEVANIEPGPVITRFELDLAPGVKIAQINNLAKDLARALAVTSVRIVDIIPGKPYVGLEIPNKHRETVYFKEGLYCEEYRSSTHPLTILLGKDVAGNQVVANLEKMPHLLIAGTTGSGKSVGINTILLSLLYKARPEELRLILIDPKMLELSVYEDIPHLLAPVVTDMKESANALRWAVAEMERRYLLMSKFKVRNIDGFNELIRKGIEEGTPHLDPLWNAANEVSDHATAPVLEPLPYIVIVIDELADMMMSVGKAVEELIARLTQKARAAGIHLVVATQRPSVDVITGLIKANIPSRIAFQVSSRIDSRTVLDQQGAENLLGRGDMLYLPIGTSIPIRVHGAFVNDNEVNHVADFLRLTGPPNYVEEILRDPTEEIPGLSEEAAGYAAAPDDTEDVLFDEAVRIVVEDQRASISYLQRKLRIGYQRAARLIEAMEEQGFISAPEGNGNREILIK